MQRYRDLFDTGYVPEPESLTFPRSNYYGEPAFNHSTTQQGSISIEFTHSFSDRWNYRGALNALQSKGAMRNTALDRSSAPSPDRKGFIATTPRRSAATLSGIVPQFEPHVFRPYPVGWPMPPLPVAIPLAY
jgi:hypothetical protein